MNRVPWEKFFLLWFLAFLMGSSLLWLHYGFTPRILVPALWLVLAAGALLLWATTRPRWQKAHCSWCGARVTASAMKYDEKRNGWMTIYYCLKCGHTTEKIKTAKHD